MHTRECFSCLEQLYEAHKHMNIEKLEKSHSYEALQSARNLAEEMQKQASSYARAAGQEKGGLPVLTFTIICERMKLNWDSSVHIEDITVKLERTLE